MGRIPSTDGELPGLWIEVMESYGASSLSSAKPENVQAGSEVDIERVDLEGYPPDVLVAYAKRHDASLVVLGTRGRGDLASLILGSTSHRAIQLADRDVLIVKPTIGETEN